MRAAYAVAFVLAGFATAIGAGCNSNNRDLFIVQYDAGEEAEAAPPADAEPEIDPTLGGPCTEDAQCDDLIPCTVDRCDLALTRCRNTPDDARCADGQFCNGIEKCKVRQGCVAGPVETCQDSNGCTINRCIEETKTCEHELRDVDGDGDPDNHCAPKKDCDDGDPTVNSTSSEICGNFKDDNCNGDVDELPCSSPKNDLCSTAFSVTAPGTYLLSTIAAGKEYATTCSVAAPAAARDLVVAIAVPPGVARDVLVRTETSNPTNEVAVALQSTCGNASSEIACGHILNLREARAIARGVAGGSTLYAIVTTQKESSVDVRVDLPEAKEPPGNEDCTAPAPVEVDKPFTVSIVDAKKDVPSACDVTAKTGELTYSFQLGTTRDVRIFASTILGLGAPVVSLRAPSCTDELRCRAGSSPPIFARALEAGTYVFTVAATSQIDANVYVQTFEPSPAPADQTCSSAPELEKNKTFTVSLADHEDAISNGCLSGGLDAAYKLLLTEPSDVILVGRFGNNDNGGVSLNRSTCKGSTDTLECATGTGPVRVARHGIGPGDFRVVVADTQGQSPSLTALVRPALAPTTVTADACDSPAAIIPETGGYFIGDTTDATANFNAGCDAVGQAEGGARNQILRLDLTQRRRVIFDMLGTTMTAIMDLRQGGACPGLEFPDSCFVNGAQRPYLDTTLDPGTYWLQIDGFNGSSGKWALDVRTLPP